MKIEEFIKLPPRTCLEHSLFGTGYLERVVMAGTDYGSVIIDFVDHGRKELQLAFCSHKIERAERPRFQAEIEALVMNGLVPVKVMTAEAKNLRASGEEPRGYFERRGLLQTPAPIDYATLATETVELHPTATFGTLIASMQRACRGEADHVECLIALRKAKGIK